MQRPATSLLETIIREEIVSLREQFNKTPKATAGDIQRFLGVSVDGDFGDDSAKAAADFIYGKNTSHGIQTVSDLYDRMQSDGWAVGAKTGTIFGPQMAKSIVQLISLRQGPSGWEKKEKSYSGYPTLNKWKFGLDHGGRDKYSTTQVTDFNKSFQPGQKNPNVPTGVNTLMTQEQASTIFRKWMTKSYIGVKTPRKYSILGMREAADCGGLENLVNSLQNITLNELAALFQINTGQGNPNNLFNYIISYGNKYYPSVKGKGKIRTSSCDMYPETKSRIGDEFIAVEKHIRGLIDTGAAFYEELRNIGDVWIDLKTSIEISLSYLGQYLDIHGYGDNGNYHLAVKRSDGENFGAFAAMGATGMGGGGGGLAMVELSKEYPHEVALVLSIGTSFLGPIGLLISSGIMVVDAELYRREGNYKMAGISALFAVLPFLKVPGLKAWTKAQWAKFGQRVGKNTYETLAASDKVVLTQLAKSSQTIKLAVQRFTDSAAKGAATKYTKAEMKSDPIKFITRKFANGTLKTAKLTAFLAKTAIPYLTASEAWEFIYETYGIGKLQVNAMTDYEIENWLAKSKEDLKDEDL